MVHLLCSSEVNCCCNCFVLSFSDILLVSIMGYYRAKSPVHLKISHLALRSYIIINVNLNKDSLILKAITQICPCTMQIV